MVQLAPYIYAWSRNSHQFQISTLSDVARVHPQLKSIVLAFLTSDRYQEIKSWREDCLMNKQIHVILSIGGALGEFPTPNKRLDDEVNDVLNLLDEMKINQVDLDIEGKSLEDAQKRMQWITFAQHLQYQFHKRFGKPLSINITIPIEFNGGFNWSTRQLIKGLKSAGVVVNVYNCMIMCFNTKLKGKSWGSKCCEVINAAFDYLHSQYNEKSEDQIWQMMGICPMIGKNDDNITLITLQDWKFILEFSKRQRIGFISFWAINRDQKKPTLKFGGCYQYSLSQSNHHQYMQMMLQVFNEGKNN